MSKEGKLGKVLAYWLGSFVVIAIVLFFYGGVPLLPLLLAGGVTFLVTVARHRRSSA